MFSIVTKKAGCSGGGTAADFSAWQGRAAKVPKTRYAAFKRDKDQTGTVIL